MEPARFDPCGKGNPAPALVALGTPTQVRVVKDRHLFFRVGDVDAVWWSGAARRDELGSVRAVLGTLGMNTWQGRAEARLTVEDVA